MVFVYNTPIRRRGSTTITIRHMNKKRPIYLDYHATTPVREEVLKAMLPFLTEQFGNPASRTHEYGLEAQNAVEGARAAIAAGIGAKSESEVVFVSGATEANNLALRGLVKHLQASGRTHIITTAVEHKSVLDTCAALQRDHGIEVTYLPVNSDGSLDLALLERTASAKTGLISVMAANNEVGTINPIPEIGRIAERVGALLHVDAAQALGKVPLNVEADGIHLLSISGHKVYGPKGIGAIYVRRRRPRVELQPIITGGGHENGLRSGTLSTPLIVALGEAVRLSVQEMKKSNIRLSSLRDQLLDGLKKKCPSVQVNGTMETRLPNNLNVSFPNVDSEALMLSLRDSIAVSNGSACTAADWKSSYVLKAMGLDEARARGAIRFSIGIPTTVAEINAAIELFAEKVTSLQSMVTRRPSQPTELAARASKSDRSSN